MEIKDIKPGYSLKTSEMVKMTGYSRDQLLEMAYIRGQRYAVKPTPNAIWRWDYTKFMEHMERRQEATRKETVHYDRSALGIRKYTRHYA